MAASLNPAEGATSSRSARAIVVVGTLDTKREELSYLKSQVELRGREAILIDVSLKDNVGGADISRDEVVKEAGIAAGSLKEVKEEWRAAEVMVRGLRRVLTRLYREDKIAGVVAVGGSMGTSMASAAMKALPLGFPKLIVSAYASHNVRPYVGSKDITLMYSPMDFWGLNQYIKQLLSNAAAAICGMADAYEGSMGVPSRMFVAVTTKGARAHVFAWRIRDLLAQRGLETVVFEAIGTGGEAYEDFVANQPVLGCLDLAAAHEVVNYLCGAVHSAGPNRLKAAAEKGVAQVVAPGSLDYLVFGPLDTLPKRYRRGRNVYVHNPVATLVRTEEREVVRTARFMADRLNKAKGPVAVLIPLRGFSEFDKEGEVFYDPEVDLAFVNELKRRLEPKVRVVELDAHINDPGFAEEAVRLLEELVGEGLGPL